MHGRDFDSSCQPRKDQRRILKRSITGHSQSLDSHIAPSVMSASSGWSTNESCDCVDQYFRVRNRLASLNLSSSFTRSNTVVSLLFIQIFLSVASHNLRLAGVHVFGYMVSKSTLLPSNPRSTALLMANF